MDDSSGDLKSAFKWSLIAHGALVAFVAIKGLVFPSSVKPYIPTLKVDVVALPDILKKNKKNIKITKDKPKKETKAPPKAAKKPEKRPKKKGVNLSKKREKAREKKMESVLDRIKKQAAVEETQLIKGNKVSPGTTLSGRAKEAAEASYYDILLEEIRKNWALPIWLARKNLSARVALYIDASGRPQGVRFVKTSGDPQFDDEVKKAIQLSQPFPPPPPELVSSIRDDGILLGFPL